MTASRFGYTDLTTFIDVSQRNHAEVIEDEQGRMWAVFAPDDALYWYAGRIYMPDGTGMDEWVHAAIERMYGGRHGDD